MADRPEFAVPEDLVRMLLREHVRTVHAVADILPSDFRQALVAASLRPVHHALVVPITLDVLRGILHHAVVVERTRLQHAPLVRELERRIHVVGVDNPVVVPEAQLVQRPGRVPAGRADDDPAVRVLLANGLQRAVGEIVPLLGIDVADLVQQLEGEAGLVVVAALELEPERHKTVLQALVVQQLNLLLDVAVVADGLVEVEHHVEVVLLAPANEVVDLLERPFAIFPGCLLEDNLVEAEADVVEPHRLDVRDVLLRNVRIKVLQVADGDLQATVLGEDVEPLVVREPAADAHAPRETGPVLRLHQHRQCRHRGHAQYTLHLQPTPLYLV